MFSNTSHRWFTLTCKLLPVISLPKKIFCVLPQRSILGLLSLLSYTNDMPESLNFCIASMYANDTEMYASKTNVRQLYYICAANVHVCT